MTASGSKFSAELGAALDHGIDVTGRRIFLHGDVDEGTIGVAIRGMYLLADLKSAPIELFITSYGGYVDEAFALHDVTRTIRVPVHTVALGKCQSAAPLLVACGHPGERWASANTTFMMHDSTLDVSEGSPAYILGQAEHAKRQSTRFARLLASYTKKSAAHWASLGSGKMDRFFGAKEARNWGLIDEIWDEKG